jgi:hypothetical protein
MFQPHRMNRQMESEMKILVSKVALAASVALATLVAAGAASGPAPASGGLDRL